MSKPPQIKPLAKAGHINWLNYGEPGVGKSVLAGTSPNALHLASHPDETVSMRDSGSDLWIVPDYDELAEACEYVMHEGHKEYDWVWLDNGTLMQEQGLDNIMEDVVAQKPHLNRWIPDRPQYLINQNRYSHLIRMLVQAPVNFGMTAHVMVMTTEDDTDLYVPLLQGGQGIFSQKVCGYMNLVTYMKVAKKEGQSRRVLYTSNTGKIQAKDRFGVLEPRVVDPTVPAIVSAIQGKPKPRPRRRKTTTKQAS